MHWEPAVPTVLRDIISTSPFQSPRGYCQVSSPISMSLVLNLGRLKAIWQQCVTPKSHWGWGTPLWETCQLEYVVKGLKQSYRPGSTQTRFPISPPILRGLCAMWSEHVENHDASMLWAWRHRITWRSGSRHPRQTHSSTEV